MNKNLMFRNVGLLLLITCLVSTGTILGYKTITRGAEPPTALPEGAIQMPDDLRQKFDTAVKAAEEAKKTFDSAQGTAQQCIRVTMDRAGVAPGEFPNYEWNAQCGGGKGCVQKRAQERK